MKTLGSIGILSFLLGVADVGACLHPPWDYKGSLEESSQQAFIFFAQGREELILKVDYRTRGGPPPSSLAWVVPVPSLPDAYDVESAQVFEDLFRYFEDRRPPVKSPTQAFEIELYAKVCVGEYEIQPLKVRGKAAGPALNDWLTKNGFAEVPFDNMKYYLERGWTFLAIKIPPEKGKTVIEKEGGFRPLRVSFATDRLVYPLKFSSHQGAFDVTLYVLSPQGLPQGRSGWPSDALEKRLIKFGFNHAFLAAPADPAAQASTERYPELFKLWEKIRKEGRIRFTKGVLNKMMARGINSRELPLSEWDEDFSIQLP